MAFKNPSQPKLLYDSMKCENQIEPSVNSAKSLPVAKDDKINGLIPLEENTIFVFSRVFHSSYVWCWMFDVGYPSASSIYPFEIPDLLCESSPFKSIQVWIAWWYPCTILGMVTVKPFKKFS